MTDLPVSLSVVGAAVLLCEAVRRAAERHVSRDYWDYLLELASTVQLCWCALELRLLGESAELPVSARLTLLYVVTVVHLGTFRGATCSFISPLEKVSRRKISFKEGAVLVSCQFVAALAAQGLAILVWSRGWSDIHVRHQRFEYKCFDPLGGTVVEAAAVELIGSFIIQAVVLHLHKLQSQLRVHALSAAITAVVYAGGGVSGAVLNPILAVSLQFPCSGHSYLQYMFIYWLGPTLGVFSCNLLCESLLPFLRGKSLDKQKTQ